MACRCRVNGMVSKLLIPLTWVLATFDTVPLVI